MSLEYCKWCGAWLVDRKDYCSDECEREYEELLDSAEDDLKAVND